MEAERGPDSNLPDLDLNADELSSDEERDKKELEAKQERHREKREAKINRSKYRAHQRRKGFDDVDTSESECTSEQLE